MAVVIRLSRQGGPKAPFYRIIASPKGSRRDSKFLEVLGTYDPMTNPPTVKVKAERIQAWVNKGAQPTQTVAGIINHNIPNFLEERETHKRSKIQAARKARKARAGKSSKGKK